MVRRPSSLSSFCTGGDGVFLIGEAAGLISPSSFEGISSAINSAVALSKAFSSRGNTLRKYNSNLLPLKLKLLMKNLKCPFMYNPLLRAAVMKSGVSSLRI